MKLNSESIQFNPAALSFQEQRFSISAGVSGIFSKAKYSEGTIKATSDNKVSTPLYLYFSYKATDRLAIGLGFNTPYGSSMNWGKSWAGAHLVQDIDLKSYNIQPTVSYKILDNLSIGAGLMVSFGNFSLSRSLLPIGTGSRAISSSLSSAATTYQAVSNQYASAGQAELAAQYAALATQASQGASYIGGITDDPLVSATLSGSSKVAWGINVGAFWDINDKWSLGLTYRSKMRMKVKRGEAELNYYNAQVESILNLVNQASISAGGSAIIPALDKGTFRTELPLPSNLTIGASFRPNSMWQFAVDLQYVGWKAYKHLTVKFNEPELAIEDIYSIKSYKNTLVTRIGTECYATDWMTVRLGFYLDRSPVRSDHLNPETPSMTKAAYTAGFSFMPTKSRNFSIDVAYGYISPADPERTGSYPYEFNGTSMPFSGNYRVRAHNVSIVVNLSF